MLKDMKVSTGPPKTLSLYEIYQQTTTADGGKEEHGLSTSNSDILHQQWSKDPSLPIPDLERSQFLVKRGPSTPCGPLAGQDASTRTQEVGVEDFSRKRPFLSDGGNHEIVGVEAVPMGGEEKREQNHDSEYKLAQTSTKSGHAKPLTEEEKTRERSRKGRERSLRTRRRNIARLRLLEENCVHFSKENAVLRELARSLGQQNAERVIELLKQYDLLNEEKPETHKLSQSESHYMDLLSPFSVTASTATGESDSKLQKAPDAMLKTEHALVPCTYKGLRNMESSEGTKHTHAVRDISAHHLQKSVPEISGGSRARENNLSSTDVFDSVFADPAYCDEQVFRITLEAIYEQPPLSVEEICHLLEEGRSLAELLR